MDVTPMSAEEAKRISDRKPWKDGWYPARIDTAVEKFSSNDNRMIELSLIVTGRDGSERVLPDWLTNAKIGAAKLRNACIAVDILDQYNSGKINQADFPGKDVQVKLVTQKRGGFSGNRIEDYKPA